jgi:hypothetical protein
MTQRAAESVLAARFMPLAFPAILTTITRSQNRRFDACAEAIDPAMRLGNTIGNTIQ